MGEDQQAVDAAILDGPYEYRVGVKDAGDAAAEYDEPRASEQEAREYMATLIEVAEPPYDDVWIERRPCVTWERRP